MSEESATPDLDELSRQFVAAGDLDLVMSFYAPDAVWDLSSAGLGTFEGHASIRDFYEDWLASYESHDVELQELRELGNGVVLVVNRLKGRLAGSTSDTGLLQAWVIVWVEAKIARMMSYLDLDQARAAAERLVEERG